MKRNTIKTLRILLHPFGWLYALAVGIRNRLFNAGILPQKSYPQSVITVGNLTVGGTGKTPHVEYILGILSDKFHVAEISRGYKRKTRGFVEASKMSDAITLGDEAYQVFRKFPNVKVAVDANRCRAIETLNNRYPDIDAFVLDDAYQHRYVEPGISILLIDFNRMITEDRMLPYGNLREPASARERADIMIVTKCPTNLSQLEYRELRKRLEPRPYQDLFFTTYIYSAPRALFGKCEERSMAQSKVLLLTAIAEPGILEEYVKTRCASLEPMHYPDHHAYTEKDWDDISKVFHAMNCKDKMIVVTDKDAAKIVSYNNVPDKIRQHIYVISLKVDFLQGTKEKFDSKIIGYVEKNRRNSLLFKG